MVGHRTRHFSEAFSPFGRKKANLKLAPKVTLDCPGKHLMCRAFRGNVCHTSIIHRVIEEDGYAAEIEEGARVDAGGTCQQGAGLDTHNTVGREGAGDAWTAYACSATCGAG
jgi:hypothetical protein